jgi:VWFA-related protein
MFPKDRSRKFGRAIIAAVLCICALASGSVAQTQSSQQQPQGQQQPPAQPQVPGAGGPQGDIGPIVIPKKKEEAPTAPAPKPKTENLPDFSLSVDVPLVQLDVLVTTKDGQFIPGLKKENFRVMEDGVPQQVAQFNQADDAPITAVLLVEFAANGYAFMYDALNASYTFASSLKKDDWVAVMTYDMHTRMLTDFTQDKRQILGSLQQLRIPGFRETNLFDALYETLDRLEGVEGRKHIILVSNGIDTFSKINLDTILKKVKATPEVTIWSIGTGQALRLWLDSRRGGMPGPMSTEFLQADNQLNTFSRMTGGRAYFPRFQGEFGEIFRDIAANIRNQYQLAYRPTNAKHDGSFRKLKVELSAPNGGPLTIKNEKGKEMKYKIVAREGYTAKQEVE